MAHDVFLSHSAKDKTVADAICARLEGEGVRCWVAPRDILPGAEWGDAIMGAIGACPVMVLILSRNSNDSPQVRREVERAIHRGVMVIPFRIEEMEPTGSMEYFLSTPHWLDAIQPPLESHIARLAETAKALLGQSAPSGEPTSRVATPISPPVGSTPAPATPRAGLSRRVMLLGGAALVGLAAIAVTILLRGDPELPRIVSEPAHGATDVSLDIGLLRFTFDRPMAQESWTVWESDQGRFPELAGEIADPWRGDRIFEVRIKALEPHTTYAVQLNSELVQNFRYAETDEPLPVTTIVFRTGSR
ncbi:MAG: TIR domain-containing protein [Planctomycetota bacterium]